MPHDSDGSSWQAAVARIARNVPYRRIQRKEDAGAGGEIKGDDEEKGAEVSKPGDAAETEADAVADNVAGRLHKGDKHDQAEGAEAEAEEGEQAGKEKAPEIGAKLDGTKVHRAGKDPLHSSTREALGTGPTVGSMRAGNRAQAGMARTPRHHVLPQEHRTWFAERGVNVDDFCVELPEAEHSATHTMGWNAEVIATMNLVEQQMGGKKKLTKAQIVREAKKLMVKFKIGNLPFIHYEGPDDDSDGKKKK